MSAYPPGVQTFMDDIQRVLGFFAATPSVVYSFLYPMLESGDYRPLVDKMPDLKTFSITLHEASNSATGARATAMGEVGKGSYGSTFKIQYQPSIDQIMRFGQSVGIEQIIKRIEIIPGPTEGIQRLSVIGEVLNQTFLSRLDPAHACRSQSLRRDPKSPSVFYIGMAPCDKTLFAHIRDEFIRIRDGHLDWRTVFTDQYIVNIIGHVYHALMSLAPRAGRGGLRFHGDLHPANVMYRKDGFPHEAVLIDFASSRCELSNGIRIGPFVDAIAIDMLTFCASLNQLFVKTGLEIPILTKLLGPVDALLRSTGTYNWHTLKSGFLETSMTSPFELSRFRDYLSSIVVPSHPAFPEQVAALYRVDPDPTTDHIIRIQSIPMYEEERSPPPSYSSAAAHVSYTAPTHVLTAEEEAFVSRLMATNGNTRSRRNRKIRSSRKTRHKERRKERRKEHRKTRKN